MMRSYNAVHEIWVQFIVIEWWTNEYEYAHIHSTEEAENSLCVRESEKPTYSSWKSELITNN